MTRIATTTSYHKSTRYIQDLNSRMDRVSDSYNTGLKFRSAGDAPADFAATMRLEKEISMYEQYTVNSGYAVDSLNLEETSLSAAHDRLDRAQVLISSAINASYSDTEFAAVAEELEEIRDYLQGLMNTRTAEGEYIFSGSLGRNEAFSLDGSGRYVYNGDQGQRMINASSSVSIAVSDPGTIFEDVPTARNAYITQNGTNPLPSPEPHVSYDNYDVFSAWYEQFFPAGSTADQFISVQRTATGFTVTDPSGAATQVTPSDDGTLVYHGLKIATSEMTAGASFLVGMESPANDNVLNVLTDVISVLRGSTNPADANYVSPMDRKYALAKAEINITNTQSSINTTLGAIGGRQNILDTVIDSNQAIGDVKKDAKSTISEADLYETTSDLAKVQSILQMSMKSFNYVTGTSLFDYIS